MFLSLSSSLPLCLKIKGKKWNYCHWSELLLCGKPGVVAERQLTESVLVSILKLSEMTSHLYMLVFLVPGRRLVLQAQGTAYQREGSASSFWLPFPSSQSHSIRYCAEPNTQNEARSVGSRILGASQLLQEGEEFTRKSILGRNPGQANVPSGALCFQFV